MTYYVYPIHIIIKVLHVFFKKADIMHLLLIVSFLIDFMMWNLEMSVKIHAKWLEGLRKCCN